MMYPIVEPTYNVPKATPSTDVPYGSYRVVVDNCEYSQGSGCDELRVSWTLSILDEHQVGKILKKYTNISSESAFSFWLAELKVLGIPVDMNDRNGLVRFKNANEQVIGKKMVVNYQLNKDNYSTVSIDFADTVRENMDVTLERVWAKYTKDRKQLQ